MRTGAVEFCGENRQDRQNVLSESLFDGLFRRTIQDRDRDAKTFTNEEDQFAAEA
jgi:hypothetical protein